MLLLLFLPLLLVFIIFLIQHVDGFFFVFCFKFLLLLHTFSLILLCMVLFMNVWYSVLMLCIDFISLYFNIVSGLFCFTVIPVSSTVVLNGVDYLCIMDCFLFIIYIILFQFSMVIFVLTNDVVVISFN